MKILLANPTMANECDAMHLGLASCGTFINTTSGHSAEVVDFVYRRDNWKGYLAERVRRYTPDFFGITVSTPYVSLAKELAAQFRTLSDAPIIFGGAHASIESEKMVMDGMADFVIRGEAEIALAAFLDRYPQGNYGDIPGLFFREGDRMIDNGWANPIEDLNSLPALDWDLWEDLDRHLYFFHTVPVMGSRGCPYHCSLCSTPWISRSTGENRCRQMDPALLADRLVEYRKKYKPRGMGIFFFYDLNFLINGKWVESFVEEYCRRGLNEVPISVFSRADHVTPENAGLLKKAGCNMVRLGIESGNDYMRNDIYGKELLRKDVLNAVSFLKDAEIPCQAYLVLGGPGETLETLKDSLKLMYDLDVEYPTPFLYKVLAGNPIEQMLERTGARLDYEEMAKPADYLTGHHIINPHLTAKQIERLRGRLFFRIGMQLLLHAIRVNGLRFFTGFFPYLIRGLRQGWTIFQVCTYYTYYGCGNLERPLYKPKNPAWRKRFDHLSRVAVEK
jgi:anaerobic magnesium-protoporphyrin IX monomethyl ester cyclase